MLFRSRQWDDAISHFNQSLKLSPTAHAHNNLGMALANIGQLEEARRHFEIAVQLNPRYADALNNLGMWHRVQGQWEPAADYFQRAVDLGSVQHISFDNLVLARVALGQESQAISLLSRKTGLSPQDPRIMDILQGYRRMLPGPSR